MNKIVMKDSLWDLLNKIPHTFKNNHQMILQESILKVFNDVLNDTLKIEFTRNLDTSSLSYDSSKTITKFFNNYLNMIKLEKKLDNFG